jgi:hypothetical protein
VPDQGLRGIEAVNYNARCHTAEGEKNQGQGERDLCLLIGGHFVRSEIELIPK